MINLNVEIHCHRPTWASDHLANPTYRLFVNGELITERTWIYSYDEYVKEIMWLNLDCKNFIEIKSIPQDDKMVNFSLHNLSSDDASFNTITIVSSSYCEFEIC